MPNRIIKESICTSENVDLLTDFQEVCFYRLMVNCDDFGRMDARPKIVKARLFPLKDVDAATVDSAIRALAAADLIILYEVDGKPYLQMKTWDKHQQRRANASKYPSPESGSIIIHSDEVKPEANDEHMISDDINCNQMQSDVPDNRESRIDIRESINEDEDELTLDAAVSIAREHDMVISAAENAGFPRNDATRAKLVALYAEHGLDKMLSAIDSCVTQGVAKISYLQGVLRGEPKKAETPKKTVSAQQYEQRSYSGEQEEAMARMLAMATG